MDEKERRELATDMKAATLAGGGLGISLMGLVVPILALVGIGVSYAGWRLARSEYRVGRFCALAGMVVGFIGVALSVVALVAGG